DQDVDLIVAAGGLPAATAVATALKENSAAKKNTAPFIFLIGRFPTVEDADPGVKDLFESPFKAGWIDQNVPAQHVATLKLIKNMGVSIARVGLIVNPNNPMTASEISLWKTLSDPASPNTHPNPNLIFPKSAVGIVDNDKLMALIIKDINANFLPL